MNKRLKYLAATVVVLVTMVVGLTSLFTDIEIMGNVGFEEARDSNGIIQIMGDITQKGESIDSESGPISFFITNEHGDKMKIIYNGANPVNFDQVTSVVCIGNYYNDVFNAEKLVLIRQLMSNVMPIYIPMIMALAGWLLFWAYLYSLDKKVQRIKKDE